MSYAVNVCAVADADNVGEAGDGDAGQCPAELHREPLVCVAIGGRSNLLTDHVCLMWGVKGGLAHTWQSVQRSHVIEAQVYVIQHIRPAVRIFERS
jgi:hypothetical protein